jgi:cytochrome c oxidase cbb3-type subunit IV
MDTIRSIMTVVGLLTFIGIILWAWSKQRQQQFDEAAHLPLNEPDECAGRQGDLHE